MTNPKVFEFAKEIGMTPLALMDKIKEWHFPIKSHMSEIEPELLVEIKRKLSGASDDPVSVEKKTVRKKITAKKKSEIPTEPKAQVIRRRTQKEAEEAEVEDLTLKNTKAQIISKPEVKITKEEGAGLGESGRELEREATPEVRPSSEKVDIALVNEKSKVEEVHKENPPEIAVHAVTPARKKEVTVGGSGVSSSSEPVTQVRRNIIGRMDLSRVNPPPGAVSSQRGGGAGGASRPMGGGTTYRPGGFSSQRPAPGVRNIRAGFVAVQNPEEPIVTEEYDLNRKSKDMDKKSKKFSEPPSTSISAKEREQEEVQVFNAVEFRKREMVFQPRKKKDSLDREARKTQITTPKASKRILKVYGSMKLADMAVEMGIKVPQLTKVLMSNGVMATMNTQQIGRAHV